MHDAKRPDKKGDTLRIDEAIAKHVISEVNGETSDLVNLERSRIAERVKMGCFYLHGNALSLRYIA